MQLWVWLRDHFSPHHADGVTTPKLRAALKQSKHVQHEAEDVLQEWHEDWARLQAQLRAPPPKRQRTPSWEDLFREEGR